MTLMEESLFGKGFEKRNFEMKQSGNFEDITSDFPLKLYNYFNEFAVGQDKYKMKLSMAIYRLIKHNDPSSLLVVGNTGTGKTYLIELLHKCPFLPKDFIVEIFDVSRLTPSGFQGNDLGDIFKRWKAELRKIRCLKTKGLIYFDEIDKIIAPSYDSKGENVNKFVQHQLMNCLCGQIVEGVDTSSIVFVMGGAFLSLNEIRNNNSKQTIGFSSVDNTKENNINIKNLRDDLQEVGAQRELLGRINSIVKLEKLNTKQLKAILLHPTKGVVAKKKNILLQDGISFDIDPDAVEVIVETIVNQDLGARSVQTVIEELLGTYDFYMLKHGLKHMRITKNVLLGEKPVFSY